MQRGGHVLQPHHWCVSGYETISGTGACDLMEAIFNCQCGSSLRTLVSFNCIASSHGCFSQCIALRK